MNTRTFIKSTTLAAAAVATGVALTRTYLKKARLEELVGLRFEWDEKWIPNECGEREWVIARKLPSVFKVEDRIVPNWHSHYYAAQPSSKLRPPSYTKELVQIVQPEEKVLCLPSEDGFVDLSVGKFYKA